jgi:hypothetical protein
MTDLSLPALDVLWEDLQLGAIPFPLDVASHGDTTDERARISAAVYKQLDGRGLTESGRPGPWLSSALGLLAAPAVSIDLVLLRDMADELPLRALVAARGTSAVLAVQGALTVSLREVRDTAVVSSIVDLLPSNKSGPGQSVALPSAMLTGKSLARTTELRYVQGVMERPVAAAGSIGVGIRDPHGKLQRLPGLGFVDTDQGRYAATTHRTPDGDDWTTFSPADNHRITHWLTESLTTPNP